MATLGSLQLLLKFFEGLLRLNDGAVGGGDNGATSLGVSDGGASASVTQQTRDARGGDFLTFLHGLGRIILTFLTFDDVELRQRQEISIKYVY